MGCKYHINDSLYIYRYIDIGKHEFLNIGSIQVTVDTQRQQGKEKISTLLLTRIQPVTECNIMDVKKKTEWLKKNHLN